MGTIPSRRAAVVPTVDPKLLQSNGKSLVTQESTLIGEPNGCVNYCWNDDANFNLVEWGAVSLIHVLSS